jgi:hypothetical protein
VPRLLAALLWGVLAFLVTYILFLIIVDVLNATPASHAGAVLQSFAWVFSLIAGLICGYNHYVSGRSGLR